MIRQQWLGWVQERGDDTFWARLIPQIGEGGEVMAEINISEIAPYCHGCIEDGRYLIWTITDDDSCFSFLPNLRWPGEALREAYAYEMSDAMKWAGKWLDEMEARDGMIVFEGVQDHD